MAATVVAGAAPAEVTFNEHIAPVIHGKCSSCHRPGQSGPFSLITYKEVKKKSGTIEEVLLDRYMPPWKPVNDNVHFANDRRLSEGEIEAFSAWVEAGCPEGDAAKKPEPPEYPSDWYLGEPDLVVRMQGEFTVPAEGRDIYRSFVFPVNLPEEKWVKAVELRPRAKAAMHHALFFIDSERQARKIDGRDGRAGISGMGFLRREEREGGIGGGRGLGGHVPGAVPALLPGDLAMHLPAGADVVMQTHFHPSGKEEVEHAELAFYFADKPPSKPLIPVQVPPAFGRLAGIDIPAGQADYTVRDHVVLPADVEAISIGGHAHYICKEMTMTATLPGGKEMVLLEIDDWDLDWQDRYTFAEPLKLPKGTRIETVLVYDNSAGNPENPHDPPQRIKWGRESSDEMGSVTLTVVAAKRGQSEMIERGIRRQTGARALGAVVAGIRDREKQLSFDYHDQDDDGKLSWAEVPEAHRKGIFRNFDTDSNRVIEGPEAAALGKWLEGVRKRGRR
ncbi:MAG: EF-hand domain-containing protein [Akkermansiaceae bacterium]|nr:EF-hand domain-containing protein [Akkermansiaceae bacterium]